MIEFYNLRSSLLIKFINMLNYFTGCGNLSNEKRLTSRPNKKNIGLKSNKAYAV